MDAAALLLSRVQFAFTVCSPIIFPAFTATIDEAAAPHSRLAFMFRGEGLFVFPGACGEIVPCSRSRDGSPKARAEARQLESDEGGINA